MLPYCCKISSLAVTLDVLEEPGINLVMNSVAIGLKASEIPIVASELTERCDCFSGQYLRVYHSNSFDVSHKRRANGCLQYCLRPKGIFYA